MNINRVFKYKNKDFSAYIIAEIAQTMTDLWVLRIHL